jgi:hypothetical protein
VSCCQHFDSNVHGRGVTFLCSVEERLDRNEKRTALGGPSGEFSLYFYSSNLRKMNCIGGEVFWVWDEEVRQILGAWDSHGRVRRKLGPIVKDHIACASLLPGRERLWILAPRASR